jgi:hypothetical protein
MKIRALFTSFVVCTTPLIVAAGTINWDGDNGVGNMSYNDNWYGNSNPDNYGGWISGNDLQFNYRNSGATSIYFDYTAWRNIRDISFESTFNTAIVWDGNGNGLAFDQKLENKMAPTLTIGSMNFSGAKHGASTIEFNPIGGNMVFGSLSSVYNDNSKPYVINAANGKTVTFNTTLGVGANASAVSFTVAQNSVVEITAAQGYGGGTTVTAGKLLVSNTSGSGTGSGSVSVGTAGTLGGSGTISGATTINGTHNAGNNGIGQQTFSSTLEYGTTSIFEWEIDLSEEDENVAIHDSVVANAVSGSSVEFKILLASGDSFADPFWNTTRNWTAGALFGPSNQGVNLATFFNDANTTTNFGANSTEGLFTFTGIDSNTLTWTPVPEPSSALAGLLVAAGMMRRRRPI